MLFGLLILMAAAVGWACFTMRWGLTAIGLVAALWLLTAIVMFLGLGERLAAGGLCICLMQRPLPLLAPLLGFRHLLVPHAWPSLCAASRADRPVPAGMLNGAKTVANDACLYSEDLITRTLNETLEGKGAVLVRWAGHGGAAACRLAGWGGLLLCPVLCRTAPSREPSMGAPLPSPAPCPSAPAADFCSGSRSSPWLTFARRPRTRWTITLGAPT